MAATVQKMLNTPEQVAEAKKAFEKVAAAQSKESGVEGGFFDLLLPLVQKFGPIAFDLFKQWLNQLPSPAPNVAGQ